MDLISPLNSAIAIEKGDLFPAKQRALLLAGWCCVVFLAGLLHSYTLVDPPIASRGPCAMAMALAVPHLKHHAHFASAWHI
jgi:hypothetical protein